MNGNGSIGLDPTARARMLGLAAERARKLPRIQLPAVVARYHALAPLCAVCTRAKCVELNAPSRVPVERAIIVRDANYYFAICHCHNAVTIVNISAAADGMPSDTKVRSTLAFTEKKSGRNQDAQTQRLRSDGSREGGGDRKQGR